MYRKGCRRSRFWVMVLGVAIVVLTLVGLGYFRLGSGDYIQLGDTTSSQTINLPRRTFQVAAVPQVVVKNFAGALTMHTGDSNTVEVSATEWISGSDSPDAIQYSVTQHENTIEVDVQKTSPFSTGNLSVDLDIALPTQNSIQATLGAGNVTIDGISGLVNVQTSDVDFTNGTVQKSTSFQTNAGSIAFVGKLAPNGTYEFSGDAGSIDITLPADSAFVLDASTNAGSVSNAFHSTSVGQNPTSQLHVHIDVGNIRIHQG